MTRYLVIAQDCAHCGGNSAARVLDHEPTEDEIAEVRACVEPCDYPMVHVQRLREDGPTLLLLYDA